uniref:ATPase AAA-type core domain-containing protein n=1 Tax=viral metagenome TaxID=1070528 RepID=A0A6C0LLM1_9ZZZZ
MEKINLNKYISREKEKKLLAEYLCDWHNLDDSLKKGIFIYGNAGGGKSQFVINVLKELNYDAIKYDACDIRSSSIIEEMTKSNMSVNNIMSCFNKVDKKTVIIMDEINGMNNGDKGGINSLIKLIRPKKTKKQKKEKRCSNPIICIGDNRFDKKIKELTKVCNTIEIHNPSNNELSNLVMENMSDLQETVQHQILNYVDGNLNRLSQIVSIYFNDKSILTDQFFDITYQNNNINNSETKIITKKLLEKSYELKEHVQVMNETERTSVGLLWHENIIDRIDYLDKKVSIPFYLEQLNNIRFSDYIDRITFQHQIWQFNEMSSLIKTFKNANLYHKFKNNVKLKKVETDIRFTKVLTKYSTEYNNMLFIQKMCQQLSLDKFDAIAFFINLQRELEPPEVISYLENYDISKLDINRINKYIEKYTNQYSNNDKDLVIEDEIIEEPMECDE